MSDYPKPKYKVNDVVVGRTDHLGDNFPSEVVMIEIESARYDGKYGHWIYCGTIRHIGDFGSYVEVYERDVIRKL